MSPPEGKEDTVCSLQSLHFSSLAIAALSTSGFGLIVLRSGFYQKLMTEQHKPSLERGLITRNRTGSDFKDYETRLANKLSGDGHGARIKDKELGQRMQHGRKETEGEACKSCKRVFRTIRGVKQHQRLTKCLEKSHVDRYFYKSKAESIPEKHHSGTLSRLLETRPLTAIGASSSKDDTPNEKSLNPSRPPEQSERKEEEDGRHAVGPLPPPSLSLLEETEREQEGDGQRAVGPLPPPSPSLLEQTDRREEEERQHAVDQDTTIQDQQSRQNEPSNTKNKDTNISPDAEPVEDFCLLPGISVKTYKQAHNSKGSRAFKEYRNSMRKRSHATNQRDIRNWAKRTTNCSQEEGSIQEFQTKQPKSDEAKESTEEGKAKPPDTDANEKASTNSAYIKPKLKSVVYTVNTTEKTYTPTPKSQVNADNQAVQRIPRSVTGHQKNSNEKVAKFNRKPKLRSVVRKMEPANTPRSIKVPEPKNSHDRKDDSREVILD